MAASLGLVVPAYRPDVDRLVRFLEELSVTLDPAALCVEIDDPRPETIDRLDELPVTVSTAGQRRGKGAALTTGFNRLETDVLGFADADGATPAASVADVCEPVIDRTADLAVGSRRHPEATVVAHQTLLRREMGDAFAWLARRLLPVALYDYQCGAKAIAADAWAAIRGDITAPGFAWDVELISFTGARGGRIVEIPVEWHDRPGSTVSALGAPLEFGRTVLSVRRRAGAIAADREATEPTAVEDG